MLATHPDVAEAYVVGAPDENTGEAVHAFVVPAAGRNPDPAALAPSGKSDKRLLPLPPTQALK